MRFPHAPGATRLHGLDWLRAVAALLVVALHAGIAYLVVPMPGLAWTTHDHGGSVAIDALTWWIDSFVMPLFVYLGGLLAVQVYRARGPAGFLCHRTQRLLGPFLFAFVVILPLDLYAWLLSWAAQGWIPLKKLRSLKVDSPHGDHLWGISHLWFLQYLWIFCIAAWGLMHGVSRLKALDSVQSRIHTLRNAPSVRVDRRILLTPVLLAMSVGALWYQPQILIGFRHSWWPQAANLLFFAPWFALGWASMTQESPQRGDAGSRPSIRWSEWRIAGAFLLMPVLLPLIHDQAAQALMGRDRFTLAILFVTHAWLIVTGCIGFCLNWLRQPPPPYVKYVAEASFWIYLFHHPFVGLTQADLAPTRLPVELKFAISFAVPTILSLLTYQILVRHTWIGALLNGRRVPRRDQGRHSDLRPLPLPAEQPLRKSA